MALVTAGLTNNGLTAHYQFQYDNTIPGSVEPARTNAIIANAENDFSFLAFLFAITLTTGQGQHVATPIIVNITAGSYASGHWVWIGSPPVLVTVTIVPGDASDSTFCRFMLVHEMTEVFAMAQGRGWFAPDYSTNGTSGEGLARFVASLFLRALGQPPVPAFFDWSNYWMNSLRRDYVNHVDYYAVGDPAVPSACALLFIYYLYTQLGYLPQQIIAAGSFSSLTGVYRNLLGTSDAPNPFPGFKALIEGSYPHRATISGTNPDDPFPLTIPAVPVITGPFKVQDVYDEVCRVILEPSGPTLGVITQAQVISRIADTIGNFGRDAGLIVTLSGIQALFSIDQYTAPNYMTVVRCAMYNEQYMTPTSQFSLDNSSSGDWALDQPGVPNVWAQDEVEPKEFTVSPNPSLTGVGVNAGGLGFYGTISDAVDGSEISVTAAAPFYGVISGDYDSELYLAQNGFAFGTFSEFLQTNTNILLFGTIGQDPGPEFLDQYIQGVPLSFKHYLKYGALAMIFSIDGELKDMQRQKYCAGRYQEGVNIARAIQREKLFDADSRGN